jgi:hypothetical protein
MTQARMASHEPMLREAHRGHRQDRWNVVTGSDPLPGFLRLHGTATFSPDLSVRSTAPTRPLQWADLAEGRLRLDRLCRNGAERLSSPAGYAVIPRETTKSLGRHPPLALRP